MTRKSKAATKLRRRHCYENKSERVQWIHNKHHYCGAFLRWVLTSWDFYQKISIKSFSWMSQFRQWWQWVAPETRSTEGRLAEAFCPFPFPSRCLALRWDASHCTERSLAKQWQRYSPEDHGSHCYSSVRRQERSVLCRGAFRMLIQRPRGDLGETI